MGAGERATRLYLSIALLVLLLTLPISYTFTTHVSLLGSFEPLSQLRNALLCEFGYLKTATRRIHTHVTPLLLSSGKRDARWGSLNCIYTFCDCCSLSMKAVSVAYCARIFRYV